MTQTEQLLAALKRVLKSHGLTYRDVAAGLGISESSVKRLFSEQSFTLRRLEAVCELVGTNIHDLARQTRMGEDSLPRELTQAQEEALAAAPALLTYFYLLVIGWQPIRIGRKFGLARSANDAYQDRLQNLGLVRRRPRNRVELLTGRRIDWRSNGPVRALYEARVKAEFLDSRFMGGDEVFRLESGELSASSIRRLRDAAARLAAEFDAAAEADVGLPVGDKRAFAMLVAMRPWTFWSLVPDELGQLPL